MPTVLEGVAGDIAKSARVIAYPRVNENFPMALIIVSTYSSNDSLYKEEIRKICLVLGVENNVDVFYNIQRWSSINSQKANRWFFLHEGIENGERVTYIIAKIF